MDAKSITPEPEIKFLPPDQFDLVGFANCANGGLEIGHVGGVSYAINKFKPDDYSDEQLQRLVDYYQQTYQSDLAEDIFRVYHHYGATNGSVIAFAARLHHLVAGTNPAIRNGNH